MSNKNYDDIYSSSQRDISSSYEDIYSSSKKNSASKNSKKRKKSKKSGFKRTIAIIAVVVLCIGIAFYSYAYNLISKMENAPLDTDNLGIETNVYSKVKNIALLGLDTRTDNDSGRSDANIILTIDKRNNKIKLTTIARDTYVSIEGHGKDKLTHAYAYGKSQLTVKTLNQNFGLEITDYATINFFELARIIDYIGGVTLDVSSAELKDLNNNIIPHTDFGDIPCEPLKSEGVQKLSGAQAVCYARIRYVDSDLERGNRQKEVLTAMFAEASKMNPVKLPELAEMVLRECETSLSANDIISIGTWGLLSSPEFEQLSIPNSNISASGQTIGGVWYYVVDIEKSKLEIKDFIFEENYYSPEEVKKRNQESEE